MQFGEIKRDISSLSIVNGIPSHVKTALDLAGFFSTKATDPGGFIISRGYRMRYEIPPKGVCSVYRPRPKRIPMNNWDNPNPLGYSVGETRGQPAGSKVTLRISNPVFPDSSITTTATQPVHSGGSTGK